MFNEIQAEKSKEEMIKCAFIGWQVKETNKNFSDYLKILGLSEKQIKLSEDVKKRMIEKNIALAEKIKKASRLQRYK